MKPRTRRLGWIVGGVASLAGAVAQGSLGKDGVFHATEVLAKHDENYMPPEAAEALRRANHERSTATLVTGGKQR